jgi:hypothetical protein
MRFDLIRMTPGRLAGLAVFLGALVFAPPPASAQEPTAPSADAAEPGESAAAIDAAEGVGAAEEAGTDGSGFESDEAGDRVSILGGSRTIRAGESVRDVLVIGGNLRVEGTVRGDAVVVGGNLTLLESGRILGDVVVAGGRFRNDGGHVGGEMRTVDGVPGAAAGAAAATSADRGGRRGSDTFRRVGTGLAGIASTLALVLVLGAIGAVLIFYGPRYLETVSDTLRASTLRSVGVGLAGAFLIVPAFVVLVVALVVSIVGIPILILAVPLYPLAIVGACLYGLVAAAYAVGERTAEQKRPFVTRHMHAYAFVATGLVLFFAPVMAGHLVGMTPFLGWVGGLIKFVAYGIIWVATLAGLGAVILSRGGTRRAFAQREPVLDESILDEDPFLERSDV